MLSSECLRFTTHHYVPLERMSQVHHSSLCCSQVDVSGPPLIVMLLSSGCLRSTTHHCVARVAVSGPPLIISITESCSFFLAEMQRVTFSPIVIVRVCICPCVCVCVFVCVCLVVTTNIYIAHMPDGKINLQIESEAYKKVDITNVYNQSKNFLSASTDGDR